MEGEINYDQFIESKRKNALKDGFKPDGFNTHMYPFQKYVSGWALELARSAIWADCGLGKTIMQLEWAYHVSQFTNQPVLILSPLSVVDQTIEEGEKFGYNVSKWQSDVFDNNIYISNYEQLKNIEADQFSGIVLDESSILKNFEGKFRNLLIETFKDHRFRLCCTATPSPNDEMEIGNHSEFLGIMKRSEMLAMFFVHDGGQTSKWRLKKHAKTDFYAWVSSWAKMFSNPSDIGFSDEGYNLPPLNYFQNMVITPKRDNGQLFNNTAVSATDFNAELRLTLIPRMEEAAKIVNASNEPFVIWVNQNAEDDKITKMIPDSVSVKGSDKPERKKERLLGFAKNEFRVLVTKTKIAGMGLNYQNCNNQVFAALDFSFEKLYQGIRRSWRFGQQNPVNIYIITTDTMENVLSAIKRKENQFNTLKTEMQKAMIEQNEKTALDIEDVYTGNKYEIRRGDCVSLIKNVETDSMPFWIFSPPFADLYTYSDFDEDMGNSKNYKEFLQHFDYLVGELKRTIMPGRMVSVHCMDLPIQKGKEGFIGLRDFSGMLLEMFTRHGFIYHSRVTIWKNPVTEMQRTKALGLLHKQIKKDSTMSRVGIPDYVLTFRDPRESIKPVTHQANDPTKADYFPVDLWQKYASPVWMDIDYGDTLQYTTARAGNDEKHICPLQLQTIKRLIHLYTNEGEIVGSPFAGIGSEGFQAIKMGRKFLGFELKPSYFNVMKSNMIGAEEKSSELTLF